MSVAVLLQPLGDFKAHFKFLFIKTECKLRFCKYIKIAIERNKHIKHKKLLINCLSASLFPNFKVKCGFVCQLTLYPKFPHLV